jgi:hypothetical protein
MNPKKRVLMISTVFPPQLGGTSEKMGKRVKYFSRFGWHTIILAPQIPKESHLDNTLLESTDDITVYRTKYLFQSRWPSLRHDKNRSTEFYGSRFERFLDMFFVPKGFIRWMPYAVKDGIRLARTADVILTRNNPLSIHIVGYLLHKITSKPWVVELRDPITDYAYGRRGPELLNYLLERLFVHACDHVIQREDGAPDLIIDRYPKIKDKFTVIPYAGFDVDDFLEYSSKMPDTHDKPIKISYTGSFYGNTITPIPFLAGFKKFIDEEKLTSDQIQVVFAGDWDQRYDDYINQNNLHPYVTSKGRITREACLQLWEESHILLLILGNEEENILRIPSKFWDYLGAERVMFNLVDPKGRVAEVTKAQRLGTVAEGMNPNAITTGLHELWQDHKSSQLLPKPDEKFFTQVTRQTSEKMTVDVLELVSKQSG